MEAVMISKRLWHFLQLGVGLGVLSFLAFSGLPEGQLPGRPVTRTASAALFDLPMHFEPATHLTGRETTFLARGDGYAVRLEPAAMGVALQAPAGDARTTSQPARLRVSLAGADSHATAVPELPLEGKTHYLVGSDPDNWRTDVPRFGRIRYRDVYPEVDVVFYGDGGQLEYDFEVAPGASSDCICLEFEGADELALDAMGNLVVRVADATLVQRAPVIYQEIEGRRHTVDGRYLLDSTNQVRFRVATYDRSLPLVIDPVLVYASYLGGPGDDAGYGVAVGADGSMYVTGVTRGVMPTEGAFQSSPAGDAEAFVVKLDPTGKALVFATYLGGAAYDQGFGVKVGSEGKVYVTGETRSTDFPVMNAIRSELTGNSCAFVTVLDSTGSGLVYSTYLGGSSYDRGLGIDVDRDGQAYVTGYTYSDDFCTESMAQSALGGASDAFVVKLDPLGASVVMCSYLGGGDKELGYGIAVDGQGNVHVAGETRSSDFPVMNAWQPALAGKFDAFVATLAADGSRWVHATYVGGAEYDQAFAVDVDAAGATYVTGRTNSPNFPLANPVQPGLGGSFDAFVLKMTAGGIEYATYLGGAGYDQGSGIGVDAAGRATIAGESGSADFPLAGPAEAVPAGGTDVFITRLTVSGQALSYSTLLGGSRNDQGLAIALDTFGDAYVTGRVGSSDFPVRNPLQEAFANGSADALVFKMAAPVETPAALALRLPPPVTVECASYGGTEVSLAAEIVPPTGTEVRVAWEVDGASVAASDAGPAGAPGYSLVHTFPLGVHSVAATASDGIGEPVRETTSVTVVDTTPPEVEILSPDAGRTYVSVDQVDVIYAARDNHDPSPEVTVLPGNPIVPPLEPGGLVVRVEATDESGNTGTADVEVHVAGIKAEVAFQPNVFNLKSERGTAMVYVSLPPGRPMLGEVDVSTVQLEGPLGTATPASSRRTGSPGRSKRRAKGKGKDHSVGYLFSFDRSDLIGIVEAPVCSLRLSGRLLASSPYGAAALEGADRVFVKSPGKGDANGRLGKIALSQNVPNPFNPSTQIGYELGEAGEVTLAVHNVLGQSIRVLVKGRQAAGTHRVQWDGLDDRGRPVSTGTYIYRLTRDRYVETKRMLLVR
jgi:hypothetical protein